MVDSVLPPVIEANALGKIYRRPLSRQEGIRAVDGVSFSVQPGMVFGLVGPNRAGKSTILKILLSICRPSSGGMNRFGKPVSDKSTLGRVGFMHENQAFPRYLTAEQLLEFYGVLAAAERHVVRRRAAELLDRVGLGDRRREPISRFSKGMVQRLALAQGLINAPDLLVMDEPTEGLDVSGRRLIHEIIGEFRAAGKTVLLVSHHLVDVQQVCDHLAVIHRGKLAYVGPLAGMTTSSAGAARSLEAAFSELCEGSHS